MDILKAFIIKAFRFLILGGSFYVRMLLQGQRGP